MAGLFQLHQSAVENERRYIPQHHVVVIVWIHQQRFSLSLSLYLSLFLPMYMMWSVHIYKTRESKRDATRTRNVNSCSKSKRNRKPGERTTTGGSKRCTVGRVGVALVLVDSPGSWLSLVSWPRAFKSRSSCRASFILSHLPYRKFIDNTV